MPTPTNGRGIFIATTMKICVVFTYIQKPKVCRQGVLGAGQHYHSMNVFYDDLSQPTYLCVSEYE